MHLTLTLTLVLTQVLAEDESVNRLGEALQLFEQILAEEVDFIRSGAETATKRTEVRWEGEAARWYPLAIDLLRTLMTDPDPPECVTELLMPYTFPCVRDTI